jgi:hypothetical protein
MGAADNCKGVPAAYIFTDEHSSEFGPRAHPELSIHVAEVVLDRLRAQKQSFCSFTVRCPTSDR